MLFFPPPLSPQRELAIGPVHCGPSLLSVFKEPLNEAPLSGPAWCGLLRSTPPKDLSL